MPSLVAEIGDVIEHHLKAIGLLKDEALDEYQQRFVAEKRREFETASEGGTPAAETETEGAFPAGAQLCAKCQTKAMIQMDGCLTCLNCGDSKCG